MRENRRNMVRVFADFNARTSDGACVILNYGGRALETQMSDLGLSEGSKVLLYQDEGDFHVIATLGYVFVDALQRNALVARPDWSTITRMNESGNC